MARATAIESRIVAAMQVLGFTASDARIYLALLKHHPATGYELATASGVPRSAIYHVLSRLDARGLAHAVQRNPTRYSPLDPDQLFTQLESGFHKSLEDLRTAVARLSRQAPETRTFTVSGYETMLDHARRLIAGAEHTLHLSLWRREAEALSGALRRAQAAGREVLLFSFTPLPADLGRVLSYDIPEAELERHWPHKIVLVADRRQALVGSAVDSDENQALVSQDPPLVEMAISNLVLDLTLYGQRFHVSTEDLVLGLTTYLAPLEQWLGGKA